MATEMTKGNSPFYPGHPVPPEYFVGREKEINQILERGAGQVSRGKPQAFFVQGEYGIGKTSTAKITMRIAEQQYGLHGIYATLGGCKDLNDVAQAVMEATLNSGALDLKKAEKIKNWLGKYIGKQELFSININFEALRKDAPNLAGPSNMVAFLAEVINRLKGEGVKGLFLVLDEINGISANPQFANYIKGVSDTNAMRDVPVPFLLMICGVEERRREMIKRHQPVERIFDIIDIKTMTRDEMRPFFLKSFGDAQMTIDEDALDLMIKYSAGFPKIMHLIGDQVYWRDTDSKIDKKDAIAALLSSADVFGMKFVEQQIYKALQSEDYLSVLRVIGTLGPDAESFTKDDIKGSLTKTQDNNFHNFIDRMKDLKVLRSETKGRYVFNSRMVQLYIWLKSFRETTKKKS